MSSSCVCLTFLWLYLISSAYICVALMTKHKAALYFVIYKKKNPKSIPTHFYCPTLSYLSFFNQKYGAFFPSKPSHEKTANSKYYWRQHGLSGRCWCGCCCVWAKKVAEFFPKSLTQAFDYVGRCAAKTRYCSVTGVRCCHPGTHNHPQCVEIKAVQI